MKKHMSLLLLVALAASTLLAAAEPGSQKRKRQGYLGVYVERLSILEKKEMGISHGILVTEVVEKSPAEKGGIKEDDIILYFDGKKIRKTSDLTEKIRETEPKTTVKVTLNRDGKRMDVNVTVGRRRGTSSYFTSSLAYFGGHAQLGVRLQDMNDDLAAYFGVKEDEGVLILSVVEDSPAEEAGLKSGDVIVAIENEDVGDSGDVMEILGDFEDGETVDVAVLRQKRKTNVKVKLEKRDFGDDFIHIIDGKSRSSLNTRPGKMLEFYEQGKAKALQYKAENAAMLQAAVEKDHQLKRQQELRLIKAQEAAGRSRSRAVAVQGFPII